MMDKIKEKIKLLNKLNKSNKDSNDIKVDSVQYIIFKDEIFLSGSIIKITKDDKEFIGRFISIDGYIIRLDCSTDYNFNVCSININDSNICIENVE